MTDTELWASWRIWMTIAAAVVLVAASLLVYIWLTARGILREAVRALAAVETIQKHTQGIWALQATNDVAERISRTVEDIQKKGGALVVALEGRTVRRHAE